MVHLHTAEQGTIWWTLRMIMRKGQGAVHCMMPPTESSKTYTQRWQEMGSCQRWVGGILKRQLGGEDFAHRLDVSVCKRVGRRQNSAKGTLHLRVHCGTLITQYISLLRHTICKATNLHTFNSWNYKADRLTITKLNQTAVRQRSVENFQIFMELKQYTN